MTPIFTEGAMEPVPQTSSAPPYLQPAVVTSTIIEPSCLTRIQTPGNVAMNSTAQTSSARSNTLPAVSPSSLDSGAGTPRELRFWPAKRSFQGCISEPKGKPSCFGGYSDVWRCKVWFSTPSDALPEEVAVKVLRSGLVDDRSSTHARERHTQRFQQEAITWFGLDHPNIVPLMGWTLLPSLSFISPWYKQGNLYRHLNNLSEIGKVRLILGIAKGLEYLHSCNPPVVHGDLKPENILLSDDGVPLLTDFGLSKILGEEGMYPYLHGLGGSPPWMAPESMMGESRSCQSDTYSFGSVAFKVMTGITPHAGLSLGQITLKVCNDKDPKDPVDDWSKYPQLQGPVKALLKEVWARSPNARPSMSTVVRRLTAILESYESGIPDVYSRPETKKSSKLTRLLVLAVIFLGIALCKWATQKQHFSAASATTAPSDEAPTFICYLQVTRLVRFPLTALRDSFTL